MIYVSSDWHGCAPEKIPRLLSSAGFGDEDSLFVLGDVIDRGAHGIALLKWAMLQENVYLLLGNHESMLLENEWLFTPITEESTERVNDANVRALATWEMNGAEPTISALSAESPEMRMQILAYLRNCPLYDTVRINEKNYLLVHAGLGEYADGKKIREYTPHELLWSRPSPDTRYSDRFLTILGHTPTVYYGREYRGRIFKAPTWWDIDTGAAAGYSPMLLRLDDGKEFYVED